MLFPITFMKAGFSNDEFGHIGSFRRQMYIHPEHSDKIPSSILVQFDQTEYRVFLSDDTMTCYSCKQTGHTSNHCKNATENKADSIHFDNPNIALAKNVTVLNSQITQNTDSIPIDTDINIEKNPDEIMTNRLNSQEPAVQGKRPAPSTSSNNSHDNTFTLTPSDTTPSSTETINIRTNIGTLATKLKESAKVSQPLPKKPKRSNSIEQIIVKLDEALLPAKIAFENIPNLKIDFNQLKYIIENTLTSNNPSVVLTPFNISSMEMIEIIDTVRPKIKSLYIDNIIKQLPKPFVLLGDFNSHSAFWGSEITDARDKSLEKILDNDTIALLNNGEPTRLNPSNGRLSTIDLSFSSVSIAQRISWSVLHEIYESDHLPIIMSLLSTKTLSPASTHRWKLKNADWAFFSTLVDTFMQDNTQSVTSTIEDDTTFISESIIRAAEVAIGKTSNSFKNNRVPWWNDEIRDSIKQKNKALKTFQISKNISDLIKLKQLRAKTRYLVKRSKTDSWKTFSSSLGPKADPSLIWRRVRSLRSHSKNHRIFLMKGTDLCTDPNEIPNLLGDHFYHNTADENYNKTFFENNVQMRNQHFSSKINPDLNEQTQLNSPIQLADMIRVLSKCTSIAPGPDGIPYKFIHNLPMSALNAIITVFNKIWSSGLIPKSWNHSIIIPILKPEKNKFEIKSYRPISLLNTMAKILEKIIDARLRRFLEKNGILDPRQNGFRSHRSTTNTLHDIQEEIHLTLEAKQIMGIIALDISKAYDTTWRPRILKILSNIICNGNLFNFVKSFLTDRQSRINEISGPGLIYFWGP
ncbi:hypothetical protein QTP88_026901 [Uroleucon formosanum]